jgi:hypothetical protein
VAVAAVLAVYVQAGVEQLAVGGGREESAHLLQHVSRQRAQSEGVVVAITGEARSSIGS